MKLSDLKSLDQVIDEQRGDEQRGDEEFRRVWDGAAFACEVANRVVSFRARKGLSQRELAALVGIAQPAISIWA